MDRRLWGNTYPSTYVPHGSLGSCTMHPKPFRELLSTLPHYCGVEEFIRHVVQDDGTSGGRGAFQWRHERLRMLEKAATAILREPTRIITDTKGQHTLQLDGQFERCDESEEEAVLLVGQFRRMKICVRNLDKTPRTCRRSALRRVHQALIPYRLKPVVFKPSVGWARCGALFNLRDVVGQRVKLHYTQQPQSRGPPKFCIVICADATPFWKVSATRGDVYIDLADSIGIAGRPSFRSTWFDGSDDTDHVRPADKLGQLDALVAKLQRNGIATPHRDH